MGGREVRVDGREGCDGNYGVGAYGMEWVHDREPERSRVTSQYYIDVYTNCTASDVICDDMRERK